MGKLFGVSMDFLLDDGEDFSTAIIKERITLEDYPKESRFKSKGDAVVIAKYPGAHSILRLL